MAKIDIITNGDIFASNCDYLVNAVNCEGKMCGGIAREFAKRFPEMNKCYELMCKQGMYEIGKPQIHRIGEKWIVNFPTMVSPGSESYPTWIKMGLQNLAPRISGSIAFCALGCGVGGLIWADVYTMIKDVFRDRGIQIEFYKPIK